MPDYVIKEIKSWVEVPAPDELTPVEQFIKDHDVRIVASSFNHEKNMNSWVVRITGNGNTMKFDYFTGTGIDTSNPEDQLPDAILALMSDAMIGAEVDPIDCLISEFGYEYGDDVKQIASACKDTYDKLDLIDCYDKSLAR